MSPKHDQENIVILVLQQKQRNVGFILQKVGMASLSPQARHNVKVKAETH